MKARLYDGRHRQEYEEFVAKKHLQGDSIRQIAIKLKVSYGKINRIVSKYLANRCSPVIIFGHKDEPYYTEEELLNPPKYSWEKLSSAERIFYFEYTNKLKQHGKK